MLRKRVFIPFGACGLLLLVSILQTTSAPSLQTNTNEPEPEEAETRVNGCPIRVVRRTVETKPNYTEEARLAGVEGTAVVYAEIAKDGSPENLRVLRGLGHGLDQEALKTVQPWRFERFLQKEQAIRVATYVPVRFRLDRQIHGVQQPATGNDEIFQIAEGGITVPRIISRVEPTYTEESRTAKVGGTVVLFVEITTSGTVASVVVLRGLGKGLDESAVSAIKQWRFSPALKNGQPVAVITTVEMNFSLA